MRVPKLLTPAACRSIPISKQSTGQPEASLRTIQLIAPGFEAVPARRGIPAAPTEAVHPTAKPNPILAADLRTDEFPTQIRICLTFVSPAKLFGAGRALHGA